MSSALDADPDWTHERGEWRAAVDDLLRLRGSAAAAEMLKHLYEHVSRQGVVLAEATLNTPYRNSIPLSEEPEYPGDID